LIKARFVFKSGLPPGSNAGTMLFVHEPDPNEEIPNQYAAPTAGTLSNYDSHTVKSLVPMAKRPDDFKGEHMDYLDLQPHLAKGPLGGWFVVDPNNSATLLESSMGQFAIFVQDVHNILGANSFLPTKQYEIGSLFFEYEIEVQTAADNGNLAGGYSFYSSQPPAGTAYANPGAIASASFTVGGGLPIQSAPSGQNQWWYNAQTTGQGLQMRVQWDGTREWWQFPEAGVYLMQVQWVGNNALSDFGTTVSGWNGITHNTSTGGIGTVLHSHRVNGTSTTLTATDGPLSMGVVDVEDPVLDWFSFGTWTVGTGGSSTTTNTSSNCEARFLALPPEAIERYRRVKRAAQEEDRKLELVKPHLHKLFAEWLRGPGVDLLPLGIDGDKVEDVKRTSACVGQPGATGKPAFPQDEKSAIRRARESSWITVTEPDEQPAMDDAQELAVLQERGPERRENFGVREGSGGAAFRAGVETPKLRTGTRSASSKA